MISPPSLVLHDLPTRQAGPLPVAHGRWDKTHVLRLKPCEVGLMECKGFPQEVEGRVAMENGLQCTGFEPHHGEGLLPYLHLCDQWNMQILACAIRNYNMNA